MPVAVSTMAHFARLMGCIEEQARIDTRASLLHVHFRRYVAAYARQHYETAAMYGRRMAESFCIIALPDNHEAKEYGSLCEMAWALPCWELKVYDYIQEYTDLVEIANELCMGIGYANVWNDLTTVRWYGNDGCHVSAKQLDQGPLEAKEETFVSTIRVGIATLALLRKTPQGYRKGAKL